MDEIETKNTEQQPTTQPADNGDQGGERTFTQEEVNQIIKDRLARERAKAAPQEPSEAEKREAELTARENRLSCREYLIEKKYPVELLDVLDTSDPNEFMKKADIVARMQKAKEPPTPRKSTESLSGYGLPSSGFENAKHTPKQYPPCCDEY